MKKIVFLSGTRADFGKIRSLINIVDADKKFDIHIFATGMHMLSKYGATYIEIEKNGRGEIHKFINQNNQDEMDHVLAKTINGFSDWVHEFRPDMIVVHGDRVEAMAGAIVGALNNILVAHIEGGEVSGTIDEVIRHSVSKLAHLHFVSNEEAKQRLVQMGEDEEAIFTIGSPDLDIMVSDDLPSLSTVRDYYNIPFDHYGIVLFHPVTTEIDVLAAHVRNFVSALKKSRKNYVVIYPNNDKGSELIFNEYTTLESVENFLLIPSMRFEYFLTLMREAAFVIGNSSAGVREAPFYGVPAINIGSRQANRSKSKGILNVPKIEEAQIIDAINNIHTLEREPQKEFGDGNSAAAFLACIQNDALWDTNIQKVFHQFGSEE